jgi:hypothetical protein
MKTAVINQVISPGISGFILIKFINIAPGEPAENQLRQLLTTKYDREDLKAFMTLQQAVIDGRVKQESRELIRCQCPLAS